MFREFHSWLVLHGSSVRSADSYCSALRKINERYCRPHLGGRDVFDVLAGNVLPENALTLLYCVEGLITLEMEAAGKSAKKDLGDKRCKWRRFIMFLARKYDSALEAPAMEDVKIYTRKGLQTYFMGRLAAGFEVALPGSSVIVPIDGIKRLVARVSTPTFRQILRENGLVNSAGKVPIFQHILSSELCRLADTIMFLTANRAYRLADIDALKFASDTREVSVMINGHSIPLVSRKDNKPLRRKDLKPLRLAAAFRDSENREASVEFLSAVAALHKDIASANDTVDAGDLRVAAPLIPVILAAAHLLLKKITFTVQ